MPDFDHFRFSYSRMNPVLGENVYSFQQNQVTGLSDSSASSGHWTDGAYGAPDPGLFLGEHTGGIGQDGVFGLDAGALPNSGTPYLHLGNYLYRVSPPPPAATALRNDLGSNISVLKTLNLRFRCFLAKVHELERRNKVLEKQLQLALDDKEECAQNKPSTRDVGVQTSSLVGLIPMKPDLIPIQNASDVTGDLLSPIFSHTILPPESTIENLNPSSYTDSNSNLTPNFPISPSSPTDPVQRNISNVNGKYVNTGTSCTNNPPPRFHPGSMWSYNNFQRYGTGRESRLACPGVSSWVPPDGVGVQIDTITPEIRALYNVLAKVKRERDEYKRRQVCL